MPIFKPKSIEPSEQDDLLEALRQTRAELENARLGFDYVSEPELIEASVYEINSLQARYNFLLRKAREEGAMAREGFKEVRQYQHER